MMLFLFFFFFFKQKTAYEMRISDWSSDVLLFRSKAPSSLDTKFRRKSFTERHPIACGCPEHRIALPSTAMANGSPMTAFTLMSQPRSRDSMDRSRASPTGPRGLRSEEHTSELQSLMRISYAVFCLKKKIQTKQHETNKINIHHN